MDGELLIDETLIEMAYRWADIEDVLPTWYRTKKDGTQEQVGEPLAEALGKSFRIEANAEVEEDYHGEPYGMYRYDFLFDVESREARDAAQVVREYSRFLGNVVKQLSADQERDIRVRVCGVGTPVDGQVCGRPWEPPPKEFVDVHDVPTPKPESNVPLVQRDHYWLTPIEVPFYDALRDTGAIFAVQPWIQGVESHWRPDFLVFYDGGAVVVELDGHESHKSREQRTRDAKRERWFEARKFRVLRWTGSEVVKNPQECVRELLEILRGRAARV